MYDVKLPQLGETVDSCLVTAWLKNVGETVHVGDGIVEVTTDKVTVEVPSEVSGTLSEILVTVGAEVHSDTVLCRIQES
ncbi:MAG: biotin attachment protein [Alicyclobacillaceae bacterium]|jgi:pyruvate/2-oxoglutarate dehydrogenase complex dihydrolipoamide acyltransferase (E2) component|uniref:biotin/lipoyl-containing protein n=1 Tax=Alicyclobacillus sp. SP_1 TaxID=2942475 RepID=UPI00215846C8|nr:biotin/lipoyl-containing protein [Alicyclobacillus sp. SP_1]MCY0888547.1 biotin attachment protein [Alicyclobacillaceae bacterium]